MDDKFLYVACWGTGDLQQYDVSDPFNPKLTGKVRIGGIVSQGHPSRRQERRAERRPADGRDQPRRQARLLHQLAVRRHRSAVLSRRHRGLDGEARRRARGRHRLRSRSSSSIGRPRIARIRCGSKAATAPRTPTAIPEAMARERAFASFTAGVATERLAMTETWPWFAVAGLGAFHGLNPGMGWLFAVALGLHRQRRSVVSSHSCRLRPATPCRSWPSPDCWRPPTTSLPPGWPASAPACC